MEYNLTFLEACKALDEGKCKEIENKWKCRYRTHNCTLSFINPDDSVDIGIKLSLDSFLSKWRLVDEKPRTEERTFKYWIIIYKNGHTRTTQHEPQEDTYKIQQIIPLNHTYVYTYPIC